MQDPLESYRRARDDVAGALDELRALVEGESSRWYDAADDAATLERSVARLRDGRFVLAVVGEFSSGKSFLLNALLGKVEFEERPGGRRIAGLLATDINPSTATITELAYASEPSATAVYASGREERVPMGRLARFVAVAAEGKLHDATAEDEGGPTLVRVAVDSPFLRNGFIVADTPGLASINPAHRRATLSYLPRADVVLYLIDTQQPFTDGDASFLGIVRRYIESVFIVQTKIDLWRMPDDPGSGRDVVDGVGTASRGVAERRAAHRRASREACAGHAGVPALGARVRGGSSHRRRRAARAEPLPGVSRRSRCVARGDDRPCAAASRRERSAPHRDARGGRARVRRRGARARCRRVARAARRDRARARRVRCGGKRRDGDGSTTPARLSRRPRARREPAHARRSRAR